MRLLENAPLEHGHFCLPQARHSWPKFENQATSAFSMSTSKHDSMDVTMTTLAHMHKRKTKMTIPNFINQIGIRGNHNPQVG